jgi:hypothetical protein
VIVQRGIAKEDSVPGCVLSAAAPVTVAVAVAVAVAVLVAELPPPVAFPVAAVSEVTVTACNTAFIDWPNVHVKISPLTGAETTPSLLDKVSVPLDGMLLG